MYVELRHLRTIRAIQQAGGLARAAEVLNMTQSALSHQVKGLEDQAGMELFVRRSKPMRLSAAGHAGCCGRRSGSCQRSTRWRRNSGLCGPGRTGRLHIAIECHACFDWLFPVLEMFRHAWPEIDVDIRAGLAFEALPALNREDVDLVISFRPRTAAGDRVQPAVRLSPDLRRLGAESAGRERTSSRPRISAIRC